MHLSCWFVEIFRQSRSQIIEHAVWFADIIYKWVPRPLLEQFILDSLRGTPQRHGPTNPVLSAADNLRTLWYARCVGAEMGFQ